MTERRRELTVREYADREGVTERTVWNWRQKGVIAFRRTPGGRLRVVLSASEPAGPTLSPAPARFARPMSDVLQRETWNGTPFKGGDLFTLTKASRVAVCELWSHQFGWELRLLVAGDLRRSHVCRSPDEWHALRDQWRRLLLDAGWMCNDAAPALLHNDQPA